MTYRPNKALSPSRTACGAATNAVRAALLAGGALLAGACTTVAPLQQPIAAQAAAPSVPGRMQWLYGSGESVAASLQTFRDFREYVLGQAGNRPAMSVVLAPGATFARPSFVPCGTKPLAVVLDVDETLILNLGYEYDEALRGRTFDAGIWDRWEKTGADKIAPLPGAVAALNAIRQAGVAVIYNSNRKAANAAQTEAALTGVGLGPARHGETLFLAGDDATGSAKDTRREKIAARYCVVAMAGDQLGDFSDLFNSKSLGVRERRALASAPSISDKWGDGWFMQSNPVYGPSIRGDFDDVFPADKRWSDPAAEN